MDALPIIRRSWLLISVILLVVPDLEAQEMHYSETSDPESLNPLNIQFEVEARIADLLFNSLMGFDMFGRPIPILLKSMDPVQVSDDRRSFTFELKRGITWKQYMGKKVVKTMPFSAEDVVFAVKIIKDIRTETTERAMVSIFTEVTSPDSFTVVFRTREAVENVQKFLFFRIIPKFIFPRNKEYLVASGEEDFGTILAPGTGPYFLLGFSEDGIGMQRNQDYHMGWLDLLDPGGQSYIDRVLMHSDKDPITATNLLLTKARQLLPLAPPGRYTALRNNNRISLLPYNPRTLMYLAYNNNQKFLRIREVREALTYSTDRKRMLEQIYGAGLAQDLKLNILSGPFPGGEGDPDIKPREYNIDQALQLLDKAGFVLDRQATSNDMPHGQLYYVKDGSRTPFVLTLTAFTKRQDKQRICVFYKDDLSKIGIKVDINLVPKNRLIKEVVQNRSFDVALLEYSFGPNTDIARDLFSREAQARGGNNVTGYENAEVEAILESGARSEEVRVENQMRLHAIFNRDCPGTFLFSLQSYAAYRVDQLGGVSIHPYRFFTYINSWYSIREFDFDF